MSSIMGGLNLRCDKSSKKFVKTSNQLTTQHQMMDCISSNYYAGPNLGSSSTKITAQEKDTSDSSKEILSNPVLLLGSNVTDCLTTAHELMLNREEWIAIKSTVQLMHFDSASHLIVLTPNYYKNEKAQDIIRFARKQNFSII